MAALAGVLTGPLSSPFTPELIVVQSAGMERWLAMELAARFGVWANCRYPFPNRMVQDLFRDNLPDAPDTGSFAPDAMAWRIMGLLPACRDRGEFTLLRRYLEGDGDGLKRFQLAGKIADTFDQYTLFRSGMVLGWEERGGGEWQGDLWRSLVREGGGAHRARLARDFVRLASPEGGGYHDLPERISLFGISCLPSYHLDLLSAIAPFTEVNLFVLSPCQEYWGDILTRRELLRRAPEDAAYGEEGHPLLASLGRMARDFSNLVIGGAEVATKGIELYDDPGEGTLLAALQSRILNLQGNGEDQRPIDPDDCSLQIHSCHGPLREMEVLHDRLLDLFERLDGLTPRDVVVMTPDIERYAPYISMVFGASGDPACRIPFSIADRTMADEGVAAGVLLKLLALPGGRLTAAELFEILESPPVRRCFGLEDQELATIRGWIAAAGIRWGADEQHRAELGLPSYRQNSWAAGLDRLLLGYAMAGGEGELFDGILPLEGVEGGTALLLGTFTEFIGRITGYVARMNSPMSLTGWRDLLRGLVAGFIAPDDDWAFELAALSGMVERLGELEAVSGFSEAVGVELVREWFGASLGGERKRHGFMTGGVTFCAMLPMRSIPFRVVALAGMDDGAFPRQEHAPGFDLIAAAPCPGDRSLRDEDRYLFLEALLSARDCLYVSYTGQSIRDNSPIPPSVLVSELLDAVGRDFHAAGGSVEERLVTKHRLQAFSRGYFSADPRLFSYSRENCDALNALAAPAGAASGFLPEPLPEPGGDGALVLSLDRLVRFYANPARYFLETRLGIRPEAPQPPLDDREPFELTGLQGYAIKQELLERSLRGERLEPLLELYRASGVLPPGRHGGELFAAVAAEVEGIAARALREAGGDAPFSTLSFEGELGGFALSGTLAGIGSRRKVACRCARLKGRDEVSGWIEHLALNAFAPEGSPLESVLVMGDVTVSYQPVERPRELLAVLLEWYRRGLCRPLPFFPGASLEFVLSGSLDRARRKWIDPYTGRGEADDPAFRLCFGADDDPLAGEFGDLARELLELLPVHRDRRSL